MSVQTIINSVHSKDEIWYYSIKDKIPLKGKRNCQRLSALANSGICRTHNVSVNSKHTVVIPAKYLGIFVPPKTFSFSGFFDFFLSWILWVYIGPAFRIWMLAYVEGLIPISSSTVPKTCSDSLYCSVLKRFQWYSCPDHDASLPSVTL